MRILIGSTTAAARPGRAGDGGMSLMELLIVVVIVGILATIGGFGYRRYVGRAKAVEATAMLAEIVSKEITYFAENAWYVPLRNDDSTAPSGDEAVAAFYPWDPSVTWDSARTAKAIPVQGPGARCAGCWPLAWRDIGVRPKYSELYCTYLANAGGEGSAPTAGTVGAGLLPPASANSPAWFYGLGVCNLNGEAGFPDAVTTFVLTSASPKIVPLNEGQ